MPNRTYLGEWTPPGTEGKQKPVSSDFRPEFYSIEPISGSDHLQISSDATQSPLRAFKEIDGRLQIVGRSDPGTLPILSIDGSDHLEIG